MPPITPLNGSKTHPLSRAALLMLESLARNGPRPYQDINAGLINRFHREALTETVQRPSPFKTHKGRDIAHEQITTAGLAALGQAAQDSAR